jgi:hypothetical protein
MKKRLITGLSLLIGAALFALTVRRTGANELLDRFREIGWGFGWILLLSGVRPALRAWAWLHALPVEHRRIGLFPLWRARVIGDAVGNLMTAGPLLAEPARLISLGGRVPMTAAAASLSTELLTYVASCLIVMSIGLGLLLGRFAVEPSLRSLSLIALAALIVGLAMTVIALIRKWSISSLLGGLIDLSGSEHPIIDWIDRKLEHLYEIEKGIFDFYHERPGDFLIVCICEFLFHFVGAIEIAVTLYLIGEHSTVVTVFIFEAINRLITMMFAFIPARMGVDEAGTGLLAATLGLGAVVGVTMAVYRKLRIIFWTAIGLALLASRLGRRETVS